MNKNIYRHSLASYNLLIRLFGEVRVNLNDKYEVLVDGMVLLDDDYYRLMLYNSDSKKIRRKFKNECKYLNFYSDCSKLVDYFLALYPQFESIDITVTEVDITLKMRDTHNNNNVYEAKYDKLESIPIDYYVTKYIKEYLDTHV